MSKRFKNAKCVYCAADRAGTGDHVLAREFFPVSERANLPKAPACSECNGFKSSLETYLCAVLPFGGLHSDALEQLGHSVPRRLDKNKKLHRQLSSGRGQAWVKDPNSNFYTHTMTLPLDGEKLRHYSKLIVRGLLWHHWKVTLDKDSESDAIFLRPSAQHLIRNLLNINAAQRVEVDLGNGIFRYEGAQAVDNPSVSVWEASFLGGLKMAGDPATPLEQFSTVSMITGPSRIIGPIMNASEKEPVV